MIVLKTNGYTLVEIAVTLLISSIISLSIYKSYNQIQKIVFNIHKDIDIDSSIMPFYNQLEKDVTGAFVPKKYSLNNKTPSNIPAFQATIENGLLNLNFITTNGMHYVKSELDSKFSLVARPYMCRVCYSLVNSTKYPDRFILLYSQVDDIGKKGLENLKNVRKIEIAWNIKKLICTFGLYEKSKEKNDKPKLITLQNFKSEEVAKKYKTLLPAFVYIKLIIVDEFNTKELDFDFKFKIYSYNMESTE